MRLNKDSIIRMTEGKITFESILLRHKTQAHIALIVKRGKVIAVAGNSIGSRSKGCGYDARSIHAERAVLKKVNYRDLDGAILIVGRLLKGEKKLGNSEPCHTCKCHLEKCMREYGLKTVYYS